MLADYHTHTPLCRHAEGWPTDFALAAQRAELAELGVSDHSPMPTPFDDWRMLREEMPLYLEAVEKARAAHPHFPIRLGLEVDFMADGSGGGAAWLDELATAADWDYLIGSVHYLPGGWDVDNPKWLGSGRWEEQPVEDVWTAYFAAYEACLRSRCFDFYGHPDLVKKFRHVPAGDLRRFYEPIVQAVVDTGAILEINTAGWRNTAGEQYPSRLFLELLASTGSPVVISSDAHRPEDVGRDFDRALALAWECGFRHTVRFCRRHREVVPLPEPTKE